MPSDTAWTVCSPSARSTNGYASRATTSAGGPRLSLTRSRLVRRPFAEQAVRTEHEDDDENREDDRVGPARGDVLVAPRGEEADDEPAEGGARHAADAAEHRGGEGAQAGLVTHPPHPDVVVEALDEAGRPGQRAADEEGEDDRLLHVDPQRERGLLILGGGPHRLAPAGAGHEVLERDHQGDGGDQDQDVLG